jgi:hypothetical protein
LNDLVFSSISTFSKPSQIFPELVYDCPLIIVSPSILHSTIAVISFFPSIVQPFTCVIQVSKVR